MEELLKSKVPNSNNILTEDTVLKIIYMTENSQKQILKAITMAKSCNNKE
jgi:hypothetical protein